MGNRKGKPNRSKFQWYLLLLVILILTAILRFLTGGKSLSMDFNTFYSAGNLLFDGRNPYDPEFLDNYKRENSIYFHPGDIPGTTPFWVWFNQLGPILKLSSASSSAIWLYLSIIFTFFGAVIIEKILIYIEPNLSRKASRIAVLSTLFFLPTYTTLFIGQTSSLIFFLLAAAILFILKKRDNKASICLALAGAIKIFPAIVLFYFAARHKWKALLIGVGFFISLQLPVLFQRPKIFIEFATSVIAYSKNMSNSNSTSIANQSLKAFLARLTTNNPWSINFISINANYSYLILIIVIVSFTLWKSLNYKINSPKDEFQCFGSLILAGAICTPFFWHQSFVILLPIYTYLLCFNPKIGILSYIMLQCQYIYIFAYCPLPLVYYFPPAASLALASIIIIGISFVQKNEKIATETL